MMKKLLFAAIFAFAAIVPAFAENEDVITTFNEQYTYAHELKVKSRLHEVKLSSDLATFVTIEIVPLVDLETLCIWSSESTFVVANDGKVVLPLLGLHTPGEGEGFCRCNYEDKMGWKNAKSGQSYYYTLAFSGTVPPGITEMSVIDTAETGRGWCFYNRAINNPKKSEPLTEAMCKEWINQGNDGVTGIYEEVGGDKNKVACVKLENGNYLVFYLNSWNEKPWWFEGNFKGIMEPTATAGIYKGIWVKENKVFDNEVFFAFDGASMRLQASTDEPKERAFVKMYPAAAGGQAVMQNQGGNAVQAGGAAGALSQWSGTGFALYNNYIATTVQKIKEGKIGKYTTYNVANFMQKIAKYIPTNVQLESIASNDNKTVTIVAKSTSYAELGYFVSQLKLKGILENVSTGDVQHGKYIIVTIGGELP